MKETVEADLENLEAAFDNANAKTWERVMALARGCHDYSGGHDGMEAGAFHHGIDTVVGVLTAAAEGEDSYQLRVVEAVGRQEAMAARIETIATIAAEVERARTLFPGRRHLLAALMEEVGELAKAFLERESVEQIQLEAQQVAAMAIRLYEEGDEDYGDAPEGSGLGFADLARVGTQAGRR